eukprot:2786064-Amphidinium_carterae.1
MSSLRTYCTTRMVKSSLPILEFQRTCTPREAAHSIHMLFGHCYVPQDLNSTLAVGQTFVGTATYMSPERASGKQYTFQSDIWSAGLVIYECITQLLPHREGGSWL